MLLQFLTWGFVRRQQQVIEQNEWLHDQIEIGRREANAGDLISEEMAEIEAANWRRAPRRPNA